MTSLTANFTDVLVKLRAARDGIYQTGEVAAASGAPFKVWPIGLTVERGELLRDLVIAEKALTVVETGFAFGMSSSWILEGLLTNAASNAGAGQMPRLTSIDPYATRQWRDAGAEHLRAADAGEFHRLFREGSEAVLPRLWAEGARFDLAFIDGDHRFEHVFLDVFYARRLVRPGGLIIVDDSWMPSVKKCAAFFASADLVRVEELPGRAAAAKYFVLRPNAAGDKREWDHFVDF